MNLNALFVDATDRLATGMWGIGLRRPWRRADDPRLVYYHGIGDGDGPCFRFLRDEIHLSTFEYHLDYLLQHYQVLSLPEAVQKIFTPTTGSSMLACSISFDDGLRSVYTEAFPALKARNLPATVFLNTDSVGNACLNWVHSVNYLLSLHGVQVVADLFRRLKTEDMPEPPVDEIALQAWCRAHYAAMCQTRLLDQTFAELGLSMARVGAEQRIYLDWDEIDEMKAHGITFCSHTRRHAPLGRLAKHSEVQAEISGAYDVLKSRGHNQDYVSFPFGMRVDYGEDAVSCALSAGHTLVLEVGNGVNRRQTVERTKVLARVSLGSVDARNSQLYAAIEIRPTLKEAIKGAGRSD
jgi:peptidoglycan/xylan/chitin deacetylase (PgdA/CDA1 family)